MRTLSKGQLNKTGAPSLVELLREGPIEITSDGQTIAILEPVFPLTTITCSESYSGAPQWHNLPSAEWPELGIITHPTSIEGPGGRPGNREPEPDMSNLEEGGATPCPPHPHDTPTYKVPPNFAPENSGFETEEGKSYKINVINKVTPTGRDANGEEIPPHINRARSWF